jgi:hypothetical protein
MELLIESCHYHETFRELNHHHGHATTTKQDSQVQSKDKPHKNNQLKKTIM